jgi:peptidoglycan/xylan/chitin deacetylase (PgdA/CDA1 family)
MSNTTGTGTNALQRVARVLTERRGRERGPRRARAVKIFASLAVCATVVSGLVGMQAAQAAPAPTVVSLTFDDSNADQLTALATLQANGLHGTFYTITGSIGAPNYLTLADLNTIYADGNEIGGHTVNHPDLTLESTDETQRQVCDARNQLTAWGFPQTSFAYPYATVNTSVEQIVQQCGYNSARSLGDVLTQEGGEPGVYAESIPPVDPFALQAPDEVDATWTLTDLENTVTNAENHGGGWDILTFHHICEPGSVNCDPTVSITPELFDQFVSWLAAHIASTPTTTVKTVAQVIGGTVKPTVQAPPPPAISGAITNSSLETAITPGVPNCWSAYSFGANSPTYAETTDAHTGKVAELITMTGYSDGDAKILPTFDTGGCTPGATAGHEYLLGAWYKSTVVTQFELYTRNANGGFDYWTASPWFAAASTWTQATWTTPPVPAGVTGISFGLNIFSNGTLTTDDYSDTDATLIAPAFTADTPPSTGMVGVAYSYTYQATGKPSPTFAIASGRLPAGLTLNATTGVLSGTPTTVGTSIFSVRASNGVETAAVSALTVITIGVARMAPAFTADTPPATGTTGTTYSYTYKATGSPAPTFAVASGKLPTGLTLNATTGVLSGKPTASGAFTFIVRASNGVGTPAVSPSTTITITAALAAPRFTASSPPSLAFTGVSYSYPYKASGNPAPTFAVSSGKLPTGLTLNATTGVLSGKPTASGIFTFTVQASNGVGTPAVSRATILVLRL